MWLVWQDHTAPVFPVSWRYSLDLVAVTDAMMPIVSRQLRNPMECIIPCTVCWRMSWRYQFWIGMRFVQFSLMVTIIVSRKQILFLLHLFVPAYFMYCSCLYDIHKLLPPKRTLSSFYSENNESCPSDLKTKTFCDKSVLNLIHVLWLSLIVLRNLRYSSVTVIVEGNGICDPSSNPERNIFISHTNEKGMDPSVLWVNSRAGWIL